jgi:hypothetical protein
MRAEKLHHRPLVTGHRHPPHSGLSRRLRNSARLSGGGALGVVGVLVAGGAIRPLWGWPPVVMHGHWGQGAQTASLSGREPARRRGVDL